MKRFTPSCLSASDWRAPQPAASAARSTAPSSGTPRHRAAWHLASAALAALIAAGTAGAEPRLSIDEGLGLPNPLMSEGTLGVLTQNFTPANGLSVAIAQESVNGLGSAVVRFDFFSLAAPAPGHQTTTNTNFFDIGSNGQVTLSDTVSVQLTGHGLDAVGNNVTADIVFLSGSLNDNVLPQPLPNAASLGENGFYQLVGTGVPVADLNFSVRSDVNLVPEPATYGLMLAGLAGLSWAMRRPRH